MSFSKKNPTQTNSWKELLAHYEQIKSDHLFNMFSKENNRKKDLSFECKNFFVDFSKNRWTSKTIELFISLAKELNLKETIEAYFKENEFNYTEKRAVLHTALRSSEKEIFLKNKNITKEVDTVNSKIKKFTNEVVNGEFLGYTNKKITDVVNIGIGGSDLGPKLVCEALEYYSNDLNSYFISNIDGDHIQEVLKQLNPETTLIIVVSKSFTTAETVSYTHLTLPTTPYV